MCVLVSAVKHASISFHTAINSIHVPCLSSRDEYFIGASSRKTCERVQCHPAIRMREKRETPLRKSVRRQLSNLIADNVENWFRLLLVNQSFKKFVPTTTTKNRRECLSFFIWNGTSLGISALYIEMRPFQLRCSHEWNEEIGMDLVSSKVFNLYGKK